MSIVTGIRADESLNRFIGLTSHRKQRYADDKLWSTASPTGAYYTLYPLYDWKTRDIWIYNARTRVSYNPVYDLIYRAGIPLSNMRVCEPFGPEQRRGLWLYHVLEPDTWAKMCARVSGIVSGGIYANESGAYFALRKRIEKPAHHTWCSYSMFLLDAMPKKRQSTTVSKLLSILDSISQEDIRMIFLMSKRMNLVAKIYHHGDVFVNTLLKNYYLCRMLSFSPTKIKNYNQYLQRMRLKRSEWGIL